MSIVVGDCPAMVRGQRPSVRPPSLRDVLMSRAASLLLFLDSTNRREGCEQVVFY